MHDHHLGPVSGDVLWKDDLLLLGCPLSTAVHDISEQLMVVFKNHNFQENQKKSLLDFKVKRSLHLKKTRMEHAEKKKAEMPQLEKLREQLAKIERREEELSNAIKDEEEKIRRKIVEEPKAKQDLVGETFRGDLHVGVEGSRGCEASSRNSFLS